MKIPQSGKPYHFIQPVYSVLTTTFYSTIVYSVLITQFYITYLTFLNALKLSTVILCFSVFNLPHVGLHPLTITAQIPVD